MILTKEAHPSAKYQTRTDKNDKNLMNFDPRTQVSKIGALIGPFRAKYITFDLKKYRGVTFHDTEESCKI